MPQCKKKSPQPTTTLKAAVGAGLGVVGFSKWAYIRPQTDHKPTTTTNFYNVYNLLHCFIYIALHCILNLTYMEFVKQDMTAAESAEIIFKHFNIHQNCSVRGFENSKTKIIPKGERVVDLLKGMDRVANFKATAGDGRERRVDSASSSRHIIGKYQRQKAFKFEHTTRDGVPTTNIWRIQ